MDMEDYKNTPEGRKTAEKYADIIHCSRPVSGRRKMDLVHRAKIFAPYDALRGFDEAIDSAAEKTTHVNRILLSEERKEIISGRLLKIRRGTHITAICFVPDSDGAGRYRTVSGIVSEIDYIRRTLEITENKPDAAGGKIEKPRTAVIRFDDLLEVRCDK